MIENVFDRRAFLKVVGLGAVGAGFSGWARVFGAGGEGKVSRPNVVLVFTDDPGTLDANCYGSEDLYTPAFDKLAAQGVRFTQAYSHTVCCPARAMLMTGRHPQRSGVNSWTQGNARSPKGLNMALGEVTLAEALRGAGYRTALFGKWHLGAHPDCGPTRQGFDEFFGHRGGFIDNYRHYFLHGAGFHDLYEGTKEVFRRGEYFPDMVTARALEFIERNRRNPFFLYLAFNIPHYPEQADAKFESRYEKLDMPRRSYAQMVSTVDDRIGQVVKKLEALGLRENTIVIVMSDNGHSEESSRIGVDNHTSGLAKGHNYGANGGGGNTGKWRGCKGTFFEGGIRVPAVISFPKRLSGGLVRDQAITACDWYPTVLDLCGIAKPDVQLDGQSLLGIIEKNAPSHHKVMHWQWQSRWAVRQGDWKLICEGKNKRTGADRLFLGNLADAEPEVKNYAGERADIVKRLGNLHEQWAKDVSPGGN